MENIIYITIHVIYRLINACGYGTQFRTVDALLKMASFGMRSNSSLDAIKRVLTTALLRIAAVNWKEN